MIAITVRNLPPAVVKAIKEKARKEKLSLNRAIVRLLEQATGTDSGKQNVVHHDLDHFAGAWSEAEYEEFMAALWEQRLNPPGARAQVEPPTHPSTGS